MSICCISCIWWKRWQRMDSALICYDLHFALIVYRHLHLYYCDLEKRIIQNNFTAYVLHLHADVAVNQADYLRDYYRSQNIRSISRQHQWSYDLQPCCNVDNSRQPARLLLPVWRPVSVLHCDSDPVTLEACVLPAVERELSNWLLRECRLPVKARKNHWANPTVQMLNDLYL